MKRGPTGEYVVKKYGDEEVRAFVPFPLPPRPGLSIDPVLREDLDQALVSLGRLDGVAALLPDIDLFLYTYVRKEAVLSSQIEGTKSSLSDLLLFELEEAPGVPLDDVVEVSGYVEAMAHGLRRLGGGFPLSNRLVREMHGILLSKGRGREKDPGEFRRSQNWVQGTRPGNALYVPPPPDRVAPTMGDWERFLHDVPAKTPALIKAALMHVQFETIHPFLDGNGRIGRLLITLLLCHEGILRRPLLYLSLYFKRRRNEYFDLLTRVRREGEWEAWLKFFAVGVREMAEGAVATAHRLNDIFAADRTVIRDMGRKAGSALRIHQVLQSRPVVSAPFLARIAKMSPPTVAATLASLQQHKIIREVTGRKRKRVYVYKRYLDLMNEGTES
ncbi:MAG TPA: Fic family protein [Candidatus Aminicenantes bacterium]|nr:Fic family protein [Candidatus Aminicenantes bacterium]